jgi:membrane protease YdiL (CAAX protease family)
MWRDRQLAAALAVGPLFWLLLFVLGARPGDLGWPLRAPLDFVLPALAFPLLEEFIFRGGVQQLLRDVLGARGIGVLSAANLLTSVLFAALHFIHHPPLWAALTFFPSLVFGYFMDRDRRLRLPMLLHVFYNFGYYWLFGAPPAG